MGVSIKEAKGNAKRVRLGKNPGASGHMGTMQQGPRPTYTPKRPGGTTGPKV